MNIIYECFNCNEQLCFSNSSYLYFEHRCVDAITLIVKIKRYLKNNHIEFVEISKNNIVLRVRDTQLYLYYKNSHVETVIHNFDLSKKLDKKTILNYFDELEKQKFYE